MRRASYWQDQDKMKTSLTVEVALLGAAGGSLHALLLEDPRKPAARAAAPRGAARAHLPGAAPRPGETLDATAARVLAAAGIGLSGLFVEQLYTFLRFATAPAAATAAAATDTLSVAYYALVDEDRLRSAAGALLARLVVPWEGETGGPVDLVD